MKHFFAFLAGFAAVMFSAASRLARMDPEPDMAGLSLLLFGAFAALVSVGVFCWSAARFRAALSSIWFVIAGVSSAIVFYAALWGTHLTFGLASSWGVSMFLAMSVAFAWPFLARRRV